jgi:hypothetical protein
VVVVGSEAGIESCGFLDNILETAEVFSASDFRSDGDIGSLLEFTKSCIVGSNASTPVFSDEYSVVSAEKNFGANFTSLEQCGGTKPGILLESIGSMCFQGETCEGDCKAFDATVCSLTGLTHVPTVPPTLAPTVMPTVRTSAASTLTATPFSPAATKPPMKLPVLSTTSSARGRTPHSVTFLVLLGSTVTTMSRLW